MPKKRAEQPETGAWMLRDVPRELMDRMRISAAVQRTTVKALLFQLAENHLAEMEKKGLLPKGK